jgi:hypothetical protein
MKCGNCSIREDVSDLEHMELCPLNWEAVSRSSWGLTSVDLSDRDCINNEKRQMLLRFKIIEAKKKKTAINTMIRGFKKELES